MPRKLNQAQLDLLAEIDRQVSLKDTGRFKYTPKDNFPTADKLAMLTEGVGEVAREVLALKGIVQESPSTVRLRTELIQVAAVALAWAEGMNPARKADTTSEVEDGLRR